MSRKTKQRIRTVCYHLFTIALAALVFYPVLWLIASSLKPQSEIFAQAHSLIPVSFDGELPAGLEGIRTHHFCHLFPQFIHHHDCLYYWAGRQLCFGGLWICADQLFWQKVFVRLCNTDNADSGSDPDDSPVSAVQLFRLG